MFSEAISPIIEKVRRFVEQQCDIHLNVFDTPQIGVALSGGADSVALLLLLKELGWKPYALHCNFHLRGDESDRDQQFCEALCARLDLPIEVVHFDTEAMRQWPQHRGKSIEMLCRELRYEWFGRTAQRLGLPFIALGHHMEDNVETVMLNALRRCGLPGVKGMLPVTNNYLLRPLLCLTKREILDVVADAQTGFVEDSTNSENQFFRNRLRNLILPTIEQSFYGALPALAKTIENLRDDWQLFESLIADKRHQYVSSNGEIDLGEMLHCERHPRSLLFQILEGKLDRAAIDSLFDNISNSGKIYRLSDGRTYLLDRQRFKPVEDIYPLTDYEVYPSRLWKQFTQQGTNEFLFNLPERNVQLTIRILRREEFHPRRDPNYAWFSQRLAQEEELWFTRSHTGDRIHPFGMEGSRLVSDVTTEAKLSLHEKEMQLTLRSPEGILWLPGLKNTALYPVNPLDRYILEFHIEKPK